MLLDEREEGDLLACRACCAPLVAASAAEEPVDVGMGEDVRMHGVGSVVLVDHVHQVEIALHGEPRFIEELGWARCAACKRCGVFVGLKFCAASEAAHCYKPLSSKVVQGPGAPHGALLLPRAYLVRLSATQVQDLECLLAESDATPPHQPEATAPAQMSGFRPSRWLRCGFDLLGRRERGEREARDGGRAADGDVEGTCGAGDVNVHSETGPGSGGDVDVREARVADMSEDSPMPDCMLEASREVMEEPRRDSGGVVEAGTRGGCAIEPLKEETIREGIEPLDEGDKMQDGAEVRGGACGVSVPSESKGNEMPLAMPFGVHSRETQVRCATDGCLRLLSSVPQIISKKHTWRLQNAEQSEAAWFVNAVVRDAVEEGVYTSMNLAQGAMMCCAIYCRGCGRELGWRFGARADEGRNRLLWYEGRYGLVQSTCKLVMPGLMESAYGCEGDEEYEEDLGGWRTRVPLALLHHLFGIRGSGDGQFLDLDAILRGARLPMQSRSPGSPEDEESPRTPSTP
jgi:hypothetical protein